MNSYAQIEENLQSIDSIQGVLKHSKQKDSIFKAYNYYKIGELYRYSRKSDSAFYYYTKAEKIFEKNKLKLELAATYYGIAAIQSDEKDFTGSEVTSIKGLSILETLKETNDVVKYESFIYNNLGIVFNELNQFDESLRYFNKALELKKQLKGDYTRSIALTINNLGFLYKEHGYYQQAIGKFKDVLNNKNLLNNQPDIHVLVLGNYAHTLYLAKQFNELPGLYHKVIKLCNSSNDTYGSIIINHHLAEFYHAQKHSDSAKYYAYKAKDISENYFADDLLKSLKLLAKVETGETSIKFLNEYIILNDSLTQVERATRNKFARIRFETDQIQQENIQISRERLWLLIVSIVVVLASILLYIVIYQKNRHKELLFVQKQQEANEEIYNLMLSQNEGIEEARMIEKKRISEELHDGILGRLFGARLSLDSLNMNTNIEAIKTRSNYISELKNIEEDIRKVSHELNSGFASSSGFKSIIKTLIETQAEVYKLDYRFNCDSAINWDKVSNRVKIHIYRILQESLHNIYKHASASKVDVEVTLKNNQILLVLNDDGSGFDVNKVSDGIGLKNMKSRVKEINGTLTISSEIKKGTTLTIGVPILRND